ncbi:MAG: type II toxin-antitoxin system RelE/ParE family toxin [Elainellaceae cyanobacterium]
MSNSPTIDVGFTHRFEKDVRRLAKRYQKIRLDIKFLIQQLEAGELPGDQIPNLEQTVFKVRVKNSNIKKGKSAGYRVIYYLKTDTQIVLITLYSKSDRSDMNVTEIREILNTV